MNWSGGKDSAFALFRILKNPKYNVGGLLTSVNAANKRISMHGVSLDLLQKQAENIGLPLHLLQLPESTDMENYNDLMKQTMQQFSDDGFTISAFGDIFLEDLRVYREKQLSEIGWDAVFPLWGENTLDLVREFISLGFKTRVCAINNQYLGSEFLGRDIDEDFIKSLPSNVDPCGENGEFHTFVYEAPIFKNNIEIKNGEVVKKNYFHDGKSYAYEFMDLLLAE